MSQQFPPDNGQPWNPQQPPNYSQPLYGLPSQQPGYPQQPPTFYPQQPGYPQQQIPYPQPGQQIPVQPQKKKRPTLKEQWNSGPAGKCGVIAVVVVALLICGACSGIANAVSRGSQQTAAQPTQAPAQVAPAATAVPTTKPVPTPKPRPTPTPKPTVSPAQLEALYKSITTTTTVDALDKDGATDKGHDVHFTGRLLAFVKDDSGNTTGANVDDPNTASSSVVQVVFPKGTDITQLNEGDTIEVWGTDAGVFSGTNAFGGTVQEVGIAAGYLTDQTTAYSAGS